ncbi:MAG: DUF92 domain-containing protein [Chloroflexi bacterium]|nr:DUF92 domain-containing protein [Chloroflexota bacterium]
MNTATVVIFARLIAGLALSAAIGLLAYRRKSLSRSGILGAIVTGTLIFGFGGLASGLLLIAFFVSSSLLSHYKAARKQTIAENFDKGGQRDLGQAVANGGVATLFGVCAGVALLMGAASEVVAICFAGLAGALATANADTWATELGVLSRTPPRLITRPATVVEPGTSGGVTRMGTLAAAGGALFIAAVNVVLQGLSALLFGAQDVFFYNGARGSLGQALALLIAILIGGLAGALFDSLLGATAQAMYYDIRRRKMTEKAVGRDGTPNRFVRGWPWLNNDWVNFGATLVGAAVTVTVTVLTYLVFRA